MGRLPREKKIPLQVGGGRDDGRGKKEAYPKARIGGQSWEK